MRAAAMVGGVGSTPIKLMPKLTQSSGSRFSLVASRTMSFSASTSAMTLPTTGRKPAALLILSSETTPPLISCSQASTLAAPAPTSSS
ncbi:hypothetical protein [Pseudomonas sp. W5-36]|uniref:hypothetical protein n=1 Tax=Pseudomonas sp. W5-36 TaxID=3097455 RepID=UPI00397AD3C6